MAGRSATEFADMLGALRIVAPVSAIVVARRPDLSYASNP